MVSGKWDSGIHLLLPADEGVSNPERSPPNGNLFRDTNYGALPVLPAYCSSHRDEQCADTDLRGSR